MIWYRSSLLVGVSFLLAACAGNSIEKQGSMYRITVPSNNSIIEFPAEGFKVEEANTSKPYFQLMNNKTKMNVTFDFKRAKKCNDSQSCRDYLAYNMKIAYQSKKNWVASRIGDVFISENMDGPLLGGFNPRQQHMNAHYVKDGLWLDVHLTKLNYQENDRELFVNFIRSIQVRDRDKR